MRARAATSFQSEINVTPLVDVCLVLLIIFMVVTPVLINGMPVNLPTTRSGDRLAKTLPVTIQADGTIYLENMVIRREQLDGELRRLATAESNRPVAVRADKELKYGDVAEVLDACRSAGFNEVGLVSVKRSR
jgi:biopolymer transport protein ExbD